MARVVDRTASGTPLTDGGSCHRWGCGGTIVVGRIMRWCQRCKWTGLA